MLFSGRARCVVFVFLAHVISMGLYASELQDPWQNIDIGAVGAPGSTGVSSGIYTVRGSGSDIWNSADAFQYAYQTVTGDSEIIARVTAVGPTDNWAKAGVMIRESLLPNSRHAFIALTPGNGVAFQHRADTGAGSNTTSGGSATAPVWLRLTRHGASFVGYRSDDGTTWKFVGAATINMTSGVYIGLAVTAHNNQATNTSTFDSVALLSGASMLPTPWHDTDVGPVDIAGAAQFSNSAFTLFASGSDIWNYSDEFHYVYQPVNGDAQLVTRVSSLVADDNWAKAGLMVRESLDADSRHAFLALTPGNGVAFQRRTATGGSSSHYPAGTVGDAVWFKLVRSGNTFYAFRSDNGLQWNFISSATFDFGASVYFGLAVSAHDNDFLASAVFDNVALTSGNTLNTLPPPWQQHNIGADGAGYASYEAAASAFTVRGMGSDIWNTADNFSFVHQALSGDGDITARVTSVEPTNVWAKAGVMIRESLDTGSRHAFIALTPGNGVAFQHRSTTGGDSSTLSGGTATAPVWVKLSRRGGSLQAYRSDDGIIWELVGAATVNMSMDVFVGLAVTSHDAGLLNTSVVDSVSVVPVSSTLPPPWLHSDVGAVTIAGSAHFSDNTFTIKASGDDIWNQADEFHYIYQQVSGNGQIVARVSSQQANNVWSKAGIMIRESLDANARHALLAITPGNGVALQHRSDVGSDSNHYAAGSGDPGTWLRLVREGNTIYAFRSDDGVQWQFISSLALSLPPTAYFGLALTSHDDNFFATATFDGVSVTTPGPLGMLPPPWQQHDVGAVGVGGYSSYDSVDAAFTLSGSGGDVWNTADGFQFVHQTLSGDGELTARVLSVDDTDVWAKAGIMFRDSLNPGSRHVMLAITPGNGLAFQRRIKENDNSLHTPVADEEAPIWVKLIRTGNLIQALWSLDGEEWQPAGSITLPLNAELQAGLFVTAHNNGVLSTAVFDHVTLISHQGTDVTPPVVTPPANVIAEAASANGAVVAYASATASDDVTAHPSLTYSQASGTVFSLGVTIIYVRATDEAGNVGTAQFTVTVKDTTSPVLTLPPQVIAEATSPQGATVNIPSATATDAVTASPIISYTTANGNTFPLGLNLVQVTATDAAGNSSTGTISILVQDTTGPSITVADIVTEAAGPNGAIVTYTPTATDAVTLAPILNVTPPSSSLFSVGVSIVTVKATDAVGNFTTATFSVTVKDTIAPVVTAHDVVAEATGPNGATVTFSATAVDTVTANPVLAFTPASGSLFPLGATAVKVTAVDGAGNIGTTNFNVTVKDTTPPVVTVPADITINSAAPVPVSYPAATATDAVTANPQITYSKASGTVFDVGETVVQVSAKDNAGNIGVKSFKVTVVIGLPPSPPAPLQPSGTITSLLPNFQWSAVSTAAFYDLVVNDVTAGTEVFHQNNLTATNYTPNVTLTDNHAYTYVIRAGNDYGLSAPSVVGNFSIQTQVGDTQGPVLTLPPPIIVEAQAAVGANINSFPVTAVDDHTANPTLAFNPKPGLFPIGTTTVKVTATDDAGNVSTGTFIVIVQDTIAPSFNAPANTTVEANVPGGFSFSAPVVNATDTVTATPKVTFAPPVGTLLPVGENKIAVSATDEAFNTSSKIYTITVVDTTPPDLVLIDPINVEAGDPLSYPINVTDNCDPAPKIQVDYPPGYTLPIGDFIITVTATDASGNSVTKKITAHVRDTKAPKFTKTPPAVISISTSTLPTFLGLASYYTLTDYSNFTTTIVPASNYFPEGDTPVTITATDIYNNTSSASTTVHVTYVPPNPGQPPVPPEPTTIFLEQSGYNVDPWDRSALETQNLTLKFLFTAPTAARLKAATMYAKIDPIGTDPKAQKLNHVEAVLVRNISRSSFTGGPSSSGDLTNASALPDGATAGEVTVGQAWDGTFGAIEIPPGVFQDTWTVKNVWWYDDFSKNLVDENGKPKPNGKFALLVDSMRAPATTNFTVLNYAISMQIVQPSVPHYYGLPMATVKRPVVQVLINPGPKDNNSVAIPAPNTAKATVTAAGNVATLVYPSDLFDGQQDFYLSVTTADNRVHTRQLSFQVEASGPTISLSPYSPFVGPFRSPSIRAQFSDNSPITSASFSFNGNTISQSFASTEGKGSVSLNGAGTMVEGDNILTAAATNMYGNGNTSSFTFKYDSTPPTISATKPDNMSVVGATPTISASFADALSGIDNSFVQMYLDSSQMVNGLSINSGYTGTVTATGISIKPRTALADGEHVVEVRVKDLAGNPSSALWSFRVDTTAPKLLLATSPSIRVFKPSATIQGLVSSDATFFDFNSATIAKTNIQLAKAHNTGLQSFTLNIQAIPEGTHSLVLTARDDAGNAATRTVSIEYVAGPDTDGDGIPDATDAAPNTPDMPPQIFWIRPQMGDALSSAASVQIDAYLRDDTPLGMLQAFLVVNGAEQAITNSNGTLSKALSLSTPGQYILNIRVRDSLGRDVYAGDRLVTVLSTDFVQVARDDANLFTLPRWGEVVVNGGKVGIVAMYPGSNPTTPWDDLGLSTSTSNTGPTHWFLDERPGPNPTDPTFKYVDFYSYDFGGAPDGNYNVNAISQTGKSFSTFASKSLVWPIELRSDTETRLAIQKGDTFYVTGEFGKYHTAFSDVGTEQTMRVTAPDSTRQPLEGVFFTGSSYYGAPVTFAKAGKGFPVSVTIADGVGTPLGGVVTAYVDVFDVKLDVEVGGNLLNEDAKHRGVSMNLDLGDDDGNGVDNLTDSTLKLSNRNIVHLIVRKPTIGTVGTSSVPAEGTITLKVCAAGAMNGLGNAQLWKKGSIDGVLVPYINGDPIDAASIDDGGMDFYLQGISPSAVERDVGVMLEFDPEHPSGGTYTRKKICRDAMWVRRINGVELVADANHDGLIDSSDRNGRFAQHGVVVASGFDNPAEPRISERVPLRIIGSQYVGSGELVELSWVGTGVKIYEVPTGGTAYTGISKIYTATGALPSYLFLEMDRDREIKLTLSRWHSLLAPYKMDLIESADLKVERLSNGIGGEDGIAAHATIVPNYASVGLVRGNLHIGAMAKKYYGPALSPDVMLSFDQMEGLITGVGEGWRTNYDIRLFDNAIDVNVNGSIELAERREGDRLVLVDEIGRRHLFTYKASEKRFTSNALTGLISGFVDVDTSKVTARDGNIYAYRLTRLDNQFQFFNLDGRLARIEDIRGQALQISRSVSGEANFVVDSYQRVEPLRGTSFASGIAGTTIYALSGGQLPPLNFLYGADGKMSQIAVSGLSVAATAPTQTPPAANGTNTYDLTYDTKSGRLTNAKQSTKFFMQLTYNDNTTAEPSSSALIRQYVGGLVNFTLDPIRDAWLTMRDPDLVLVTRTIRPKDRRLTHESCGRRSEDFDYFSDGQLKSHSVSEGVSMAYTYQSLGTDGVSLLETSTQVGIGSTTMQYYPTGVTKGLLKSAANAVSDSTTYNYDAVTGFPSETIDPRGMHWPILSRNRYGQPTYNYSPERRLTSTRYDADGLVHDATDAMRYVTVYNYDAMRRLTTVNGPGGVSSYNLQDTFGRTWQQKTASDRLTTTVYDIIGRPLYVATTEIDPVVMTYDDASHVDSYDVTVRRGTRVLSTENIGYSGRIQTSVSPRELTLGAGTTDTLTAYDYTIEGWPEKTIDPLGMTWTTVYDAAGRTIEQKTPMGRSSKMGYKAGSDWVEKATDADNLTTRNDLDAIGRIEKTTNPKNGFVTQQFVKGLLDSTKPSLGKGSSYSYDGDSLPKSQTDCFNKILQTTYDFDQRQVKTVYDANVNRVEITTLEDRGFAAQIERVGIGATRFEHRNDGVTLSVQEPARGKSGSSIDTQDRTTRRYQELSAAETADSTTAFDPGTGFVMQQTNALGLKTTPITNAQTGEIQRTYDDLTENQGTNSNVKVLSRDARGMTLQYLDGEQRTWTITYDDDGRRKTLTSPGDATERVVTEWTYDNGGASNRVASIKRNGDTWTFAYDELNNIKTQVAPGTPPILSSAVYDELGKLSSETVGTLTTVYNYDPNTQLLIKKTMPSDEMYYVRDDFGRVHNIHDKRAENVTTVEYDDFDRQTFVMHPDQKFETFSYRDQNGINQPDLQVHTDRFHRTTRFERDLAGRIVTKTFEDDAQGQPQKVSYGYNKAHQVVSETFKNSTLARSYDGRMRMRSVGAVAMDYNNDDRIKRKSWPGYAMDYQYKATSGYLDRVVSPDGPAVYQHDSKGRVSSISMPGGVTRSFKYDGADRRTSMTQQYAGQTERHAWRYDGSSRITSIADSKGAQTYAYDGARLNTETRSGQDLHRSVYAFDGSGNRTGVTSHVAQEHQQDFNGPALPPELQVLAGTWTADGTLNNTAAGRVKLALDPDAGQFYSISLQLNINALADGEQRVAGISFAEQADSSRVVAGLVVQKNSGGNPEARLRIERVASTGTVQVLGESDPFPYSGAPLVTNLFLAPDGATVSLDESALTEPLSVPLDSVAGTLGLESTSGAVYDTLRWQSFTANAPQTMAYNSINQVDHPDYSYNDVGHLTRQVKDGVEWHYTYDRLDRIETATANGVTRTYSYAGATWMRTGITDGTNSESFTYDDFACVSHGQNGTTTHYFTPGGNALFESSGGTVSSYLEDGLGNVAALGRNNAIAERYNYTAFGEHSARDTAGNTIARSNGPRYRGEWHDAATNQHYLRNRQYDPTTGHFLSLDPKGMVNGANMYNYCGGDPVNKTDPMGTDYIDIASGENPDGSHNVSWVVTTGHGRGGVELGSFVIGKSYNGSIPSLHKVVFNNGYTINDEIFNSFSRGVFGTDSGGALAVVTAGEFESTRLTSGHHTFAEIAEAQAAGYEKFDSWVHAARRDAYELQAYKADRAATVDAAKPLAGAIENDIGPLKYWARGYYRVGSIIGIDDQDEVQAELDLTNYFVARHEPVMTMTQAIDRTRGNVLKAANVALTAATLMSVPPIGDVALLAENRVSQYGSTELSEFAQAMRQEQGIFTGRNAAVFEYREANGVISRIAAFSKRGLGGGHSERIIARELERLGIRPEQVTKIYSELEPCNAPGGYCKAFIARTYPNAQVTYSFPYGDTTRGAGVNALKDAVKDLAP